MDGSSPFTPLDQAPFKGFHVKTVLTTGLGVFTDGYDLSSIGIVLGVALTSFGVRSLTGLESSLLAGSALIGAAAGAVVFGFLANRGRKTFYGVDVLLMAIAALAQAFVTNIPELIAVRFLLGVGVGADYVLSPLIMGEHANARDRGKSVAFGFGLTWGIGATVAASVYLLLSAAGVAPDLLWRIVLALGAVPAASVIYLRRRMPETARWLGRVAGDGAGMAAVIAGVAGPAAAPQPRTALRDPNSLAYYFARQWPRFLAASSLWFLFDIVAYSGILFGPTLIAKGLGLSPGGFQLVMEFAFVVPGGIVALLLIDRWGRKPLQMWGFAGMAAALIAFGAYRQAASALPWLALLLYGLQNWFSQAGPGSVTASGLLGVELAPTRVRSIVQALTVASGRIGASLTAFVFPALFRAEGESFAIAFLAAIALVAAVLTALTVPETRGAPLEKSAEETLTEAGA